MTEMMKGPVARRDAPEAANSQIKRAVCTTRVMPYHTRLPTTKPRTTRGRLHSLQVQAGWERGRHAAARVVGGCAQTARAGKSWPRGAGPKRQSRRGRLQECLAHTASKRFSAPPHPISRGPDAPRTSPHAPRPTHPAPRTPPHARSPTHPAPRTPPHARRLARRTCKAAARRTAAARAPRPGLARWSS
jgi:hypothetical protein